MRQRIWWPFPWTPSIPAAPTRLPDGFRDQGVPVCLGGVHISLLPDEAQDHADVLLMGDAEPVWKDLLDDLGKPAAQTSLSGAVLHTPRRGLSGSLPVFQSGLPADILIQYSRGCPFNCAHCSVARVFGHAPISSPWKRWWRRSSATSWKFILFVDDNITANPDRAKELFEA